VLGFPIRTPWDHSSVDSSPRPIAASHVLHRLLVPRHPPCALSNLTTNHTTTPPQPAKPVRATGGHRRSQKRCSHPLCNSQQTHNHHHTNQQTPTHLSQGTKRRPGTGDDRHRKNNPTSSRKPGKPGTRKAVCVCFLRTQQGVHRQHQPHPADRSLPTPVTQGQVLLDQRNRCRC
jgi:hypothetical protein